MGYIGLDCVGDSDTASDFQYRLLDMIAEQFEKELDEDGNDGNTDGVVNCALNIEELFARWDDGKMTSIDIESKLGQVILKIRDKMKLKLKEALGIPETEWIHRQMHIDSYGRMISTIKALIEKMY